MTAPAGAVVDCTGYKVKITPWACIENQLSTMCLPGWPCEECEEAIGVATKGKEFYCANLGVSMSTGLCDASRLEAQRRSLVWPSGLGWMKVCLECSVEATEIPPMRPMARVGEIGAKVGRPGRDPAVMKSNFSAPSGAPSLKSGKTGRKSKTGVWDPKTMSRAVARDLGLI
ncbi:MAG: hypothetical protein ACYC6G_20155 [Desulfobaccales bacterium]